MFLRIRSRVWRVLFCTAASTKQALSLLFKKTQGDLEDITVVRGQQDFPTLPDWQPYSVGGAGFNPALASSRSTFRSVCGRGGGRRGSSSNGGSGKPPIVCGKCTIAGQSANHSHIHTDFALLSNVLNVVRRVASFRTALITSFTVLCYCTRL